MTSSTSAPATLPLRQPARLDALARLAYLGLLVGVLLLALTGVRAFLTGNAPMSHWVLMFHVGISPLFTLCTAVVALTWPRITAGHHLITRVLFWLLLTIALVVILSGVVPMTPVADTNGQHFLYLTHRFAGVLLTPVALAHLFSLVLKR